jgi:hypothetical protein
VKRIHFIEIADEPWCPQGVKDGVTDFCRFVLDVSRFYKPAAPLLAAALKRTGARRVLDLCSGAAGPWTWLQPLLRELGVDVTVCLSDHYPNLEAFQWVSRRTQGAVTYHPTPVDATCVPKELSGFRTIFTAFHHLRPEQARAVLADAVARGEGIAVFEAARRSTWVLPLLPLAFLVMPPRVWLATPFIRPFRWSRLFWTYLVPAVPLVMAFDTIVSILRIYSPAELRELTAGLDAYHWEIGAVHGKPIPLAIPYLIGTPAAGAPA